jgi:hypothetical protein
MSDNPLPCGCAVVGTEQIDPHSGHIYYENMHVKHCDMHANAADELARLQAIEADRDAWRQALQSLTPGGSEFTKPHECSNFVRDRNNRQWETIKRQKQERDELAAALEKGT